MANLESPLMQHAEKPHIPPPTSIDSLVHKLQPDTNVWGRPVVVNQSIGLAIANILERYKGKEDTTCSWQVDFFGTENWREATTQEGSQGEKK